MATKNPNKKTRAVKQRRNSAKQPTGKPFEKGNPHVFKPGVSGNPAGRPKSRALSEELRARLREQYPGKDDATYATMVARKLIDLAVAGEIPAIKEVFDRVEGKPRQAIDLSTDERKRRMVTDAVERLMDETGMDRDQAEEELTKLVPEAKQWIH
jgi:uncharacterized protein DUF5681